MQGLQTIFPDNIVGFKRQLPLNQQYFNCDNILKKTKIEESVTIQQPQPIKVIPNTGTLRKPLPHNQLNWETLSPLVLFNHSNLIQRYFQLLTLSHYIQQKSLLNVKRENSTSSSVSMASTNSLSPVNVPIILKKPEPPVAEETQKFEGCVLHKKSLKVSACKNYIALLCTGFARSILTADSDSEIIKHLRETMRNAKTQYTSLKETPEQELQEFVLDHIYKDICGKKVKKINKGRDFKVRNTEELEWLLTPKEGESDLIMFRKVVLKELLNYFFVSKYYMEWLEKGMINEANRNFFLKNKIEIQKKFSNPMLYKPHFDYNAQ